MRGVREDMVRGLASVPVGDERGVGCDMLEVM